MDYEAKKSRYSDNLPQPTSKVLVLWCYTFILRHWNLKTNSCELLRREGWFTQTIQRRLVSQCQKRIIMINDVYRCETCCTALNFGSRKLRRIVANKYFGRQNIGGLAALHSKIARIKIVGRYNLKLKGFSIGDV